MEPNNEQPPCSVHITGHVGIAASDTISVNCERDGRRLFLEIVSPGAGSILGSALDALVRRELQEAANEILRLVESRSKLAILRRE
jgi:hypothetical protein